MHEDLARIDASMIADLARIKTEENLLQERLVKMEAGKTKVSPKVYARVRQDYESRRAALQKESRPLQDRARHEYQKLRGIRSGVEASLEEVAMEKEELEFRRELGEFEDAQFQERLQECEQRLSERQRELERIDGIGKEFVGAFHSEEDLESSPPAEGPAPLSPASPEGAAPPPPSPGAEATAVRPPPSLSIPPQPAETSSEALRLTHDASPAVAAGNDTVIGAGGPKPAPADSPDATRIDGRGPGFPAGQSAPRPLPVPTLATGPPSGFNPPPAATRALPRPRLIIPLEGANSREHVLSPGVTSIGRSPKSDLCLPQSEVSRHHADIAFGPDGYKVIDMGSPNGIFVNGKRVKEQRLAEGDVILIGMQKLMFKS